MFWPHHQAAIDRLTAWAKTQPEILAVIIGGSLAKGWGDESSDIDAVFIVSDQDFNRRVQTVDLTFNSVELAAYEGGYIDAKYYGLSFLDEIAAKGGEPMRASFLNVLIPYSQIPDLHQKVEKITTYPEDHRIPKIQTYNSQLLAMEWYSHEAEKRDDPYLLNWCAQRAVLMAGRMVLARNRRFFPFHKWFRQAVAECPDRPENLPALIDQTMRHPSSGNVKAVLETIQNYGGWPDFDPEWWKAYILETEWAWRTGQAPLDEA